MVDRHRLDDEARSRGRGNAVAARQRRAQIKRDVTAGRLSVAEVLDQRGDPVVGRLRAVEIVAALPGLGPVRAGRLLDDCGIDVDRRLGQIGPHQSARLLDALAARTPGTRRGAGARGTPRRLLVLSGPSGVGKSSVVAYLRRHHPEVWFSVSVTTRAPRPGEAEGVDYFFVTASEFERMREAGELLEWATFAGNSYGTPARPVIERLNRGEAVICEIELQGARQVRARDPDALLVFLAPPSWEVLVARLTGRGTEDRVVVAERLATARQELAAAGEFDVVVVNDTVSRAAGEVVGLLGG